MSATILILRPNSNALEIVRGNLHPLALLGTKVAARLNASTHFLLLSKGGGEARSVRRLPVMDPQGRERQAARPCSTVLFFPGPLPAGWPLPIWMRRGFIASGIRRTRSICRSPFSKVAASTSTWSSRLT